MVEAAPPEGHPVANPACAARALGARLFFEGGEINALLAGAGGILRTSAPRSIRYGLAQLRRELAAPPLRILHVVFAPAAPRPVLLGLVRLANDGREPIELTYTELWDVPGSRPQPEPGACSCDSEAGERALADASLGVRGRAPDPLPSVGLALELRLVLPPRSVRELAFAYAAPPPGEPAGLLVRAWRGDVRDELRRVVSVWLARTPGPNSLAAYRVEALRWPE